MTPSAPAAALVFALLASSPAVAQTSGARIPDVVKTGQRVSIIDDEGRQIDGRVEGTSAESIRLALRKGTEDIPVNRIVRIVRPDSLRNGAYIGLTVGLTSSAILAGFATRAENPQWGIVAASSAYTVVAYTLLGTGIDAMFNNRRTLFERGRGAKASLSPVVGRGVRGGAISLTW
jgi:hypothetical protein